MSASTARAKAHRIESGLLTLSIIVAVLIFASMIGPKLVTALEPLQAVLGK